VRALIPSPARSASHRSTGPRRRSARLANPHSSATRVTARRRFAWYPADVSPATSARSYPARWSATGAAALRAASNSPGSRVPDRTRSTSRSHPASIWRAACSSLHPVGRSTTAPVWSRYLAVYVAAVVRMRAVPSAPVVSGAVRTFPRTFQRANRTPPLVTTSAPGGSGRVVVFLNTLPMAGISRRV
jgi:hypothetical protein